MKTEEIKNIEKQYETIFVEKYDDIKILTENVNDYLKRYNINGYNYNSFCLSFLNNIKAYFRKTSDYELSIIDLNEKVNDIITIMVIDKLKTKNSYDVDEAIKTIKKQLKYSV